jgi:hypothetical protein
MMRKNVKKVTSPRWSEIPKPFWNKEWLLQEYIIFEREIQDIAGQCGVSRAAILSSLKKLGVPIRTCRNHWPPPPKPLPPIGKGENSPAWRGGLTQRWKNVQNVVRERDNNSCRKCSASSLNLPVHHIISRRYRIEIFNPDYCISLCKKCHSWVHGRENINFEFIASPIDWGGKL